MEKERIQDGYDSMSRSVAEILNGLGVTLNDSPKDKPKSIEDIREERRKHYEWQCERENLRAGSLNELDGYDCSLCLNRGYIAQARPSGCSFEEVHVICKCDKIRKTIRAMKKSGLQDVSGDYRFDNFIASEPWQRNLLDKARAYVSENESRWLFIGGSSGTGKSHLCTAVAIELLKQGRELKYMLWRDEASRLKSIVNSESYSDEIREYKDVDVLYIDDLFKTGKGEGQRVQHPTSADINLAFEILNNRAIQKKQTIISSESTFSSLMSIDEALASRIMHLCGDYCLTIGKDAKNYRMR